jgi:hypothetical protein
MNVKVINASRTDLDEWLNINFILFNSVDTYFQNMVRKKYYSALGSIKFIELYDSGEKIGHIALIKQKMLIHSQIFEVAFLTSVYIFPRFRRKGHVAALLSTAEKIAIEENCTASIIIARRAVKDMYSKYDYIGFSVFPTVRLGNDQFKNFQISTSEVNLSFKQLNESYLNTYSSISGTLLRNDLYWDSIRYSVENGLYGFLEDKQTNSYIITKNATAIEVAGNIDMLTNLINQHSITQLLIPSDHAIFKKLIKLGGEFQFRKEPREGHLIKVLGCDSYAKEVLTSLQHSYSSLKPNDFKYMNILELNQW